MKISLIVAVDENRGIGKNGKMPWHIPADLKRFKKLTLNHPVIMGRKTFESLKNPLPDRTNIIISRNLSMTNIPVYWSTGKVLVCRSLKEALRQAQGKLSKSVDSEIFIIGGGQVFQEAISIADKIYLTLVEGKFDVDTYFPDYSKFTKKISEEEGESNGFKYKFINLER